MENQKIVEYLQNFPHYGQIIGSEKYNFIYMKPARTGGTSIFRHTLQPYVEDIICYKDEPQKFVDWISNLNSENIENYFIFTFVRNPYDRAISIYHYFNFKSLSQFRKNFLKLRHNNYTFLSHSEPLHIYAYFNNKCVVDFIGYFENIQDDFNFVCEKLNIPKFQLPKTNTTKHQNYVNYYKDQKFINFIEDFYDKDFKFFKYNNF